MSSAGGHATQATCFTTAPLRQAALSLRWCRCVWGLDITFIILLRVEEEAMDIQSCQPEEERPDHRALPKSCNNVGYVFLWGSDEVSELFPKNTCTSKCVYPFKRWVVATDPPPSQRLPMGHS